MRKIYAFADEASHLIDSQIVAMKRNGLDGLEIRNVDDINVSDITLEKAKEVKKKLDDNGLLTWSVGSPLGKIRFGVDDFSEHLEKFKHTIEIAHILGAENIRIFAEVGDVIERDISTYLPTGRIIADDVSTLMNVGKFKTYHNKIMV